MFCRQCTLIRIVRTSLILVLMGFFVFFFGLSLLIIFCYCQEEMLLKFVRAHRTFMSL